MRYGRVSLLGTALAVLGGCAMVGGRSAGTVAGDTYVNAAENLAFRVPAGWSAVESRNPFRRPDFVARFQPPEENASVTARSVVVGRSACIDAARDALAAEGLSVSSEQLFVIDTPAGQAPAWRGDVSSSADDRRGRASLFCTGGRAVLLVAVAEGGAYERYADAIALTIQSFAYAGGPTIVRIAPPAAPTAVKYFEHVVEWRGQTLGQIARWYTGAYDNWKKLTELNGLTVDDAPLRVGRTVRIPEKLVSNQKPMPRPKPVSRPPAAKTEAPATGEPASSAAPEPGPEPEPEDLPAVIGPK